MGFNSAFKGLKWTDPFNLVMARRVIGGHRNNFIILRTETLKGFFHTEVLTLTV